MYKVKIRKVKFNGRKTYVSTTDTYYFTGEKALENALKFSRDYNREEAVYKEKYYKQACKPESCNSVPLTLVLEEAFNIIRERMGEMNLNNIRPDIVVKNNQLHSLGEYF